MPETKRIWITGASRGLGRAAALACLREGHQVLATSRSGGGFEDLPNQHTGALQVLAADVRERADLDRAAATGEEAWGGIDVVLANAGISIPGEFSSLSDAELVELLEVNLLGMMRTVHAALPGMLRRGSGHIITVSSIAAEVPSRYAVPYAAGKAGVIAFTQALGRELQDAGLKTSCILPGFIRTDMTKGVPFPMPGAEIFGQAVVRLILRPRRKLIVPGFYAAGAWMNRLTPGVMDLISNRVMDRLHSASDNLNQSATPSQPEHDPD